MVTVVTQTQPGLPATSKGDSAVTGVLDLPRGSGVDALSPANKQRLRKLCASGVVGLAMAAPVCGLLPGPSQTRWAQTRACPRVF